MNKTNLFAEFKPISKEKWRAQAIADLKGKDFEQLMWHTEGLEIQPFYTKEDLEGVPQGGLHPFLCSNATINVPNEGRIWQNLVKVPVHDSNQANNEALYALNHGADGIIFEIVGEAPEFDLLLKDLVLNSCAVYFTGNDNVMLPFQTYIENHSLSKQQLNGGFLCSSSAKESDIVLKKNAAFKKLFIDNRLPVSEENNIEQLVTTLLQAVKVMDEFTDKGIDPDIILDNFIIYFEIGSSYFKEMAKLRACRILMAGVAAAYQLRDYPATNLHIHCEISGKHLPQTEPYNNMLRNTTGAMAAILGGCNSLYIPPHEYGEENNPSFSTRIASNISLILKEEAHFDKVSDPAAGSYYIENLTTLFVEKAWEQFLTLI